VPYVILGIAVLIGLLLLARGFVNAEPKQLARTLKWTGIALAGLFVVYLAATRQIEWLLSAAAVAMPFFMRWRRMRGPMGGWGNTSPRAGQSSTVETRFIRMSLDHDSGTIDGTVLEGAFAGRKLSELAPPDLNALLRECRVADEQSAAVLEAYLDRTQPGWRADDAAAPGEEKRSRAWGRSSTALTREEAYKVLGLEPGATPDQIKEAHRRLMRSYHPDMGGSDYLAARINEAKDLLLG
jgi:DnaJ-domain-containing protein 1